MKNRESIFNFIRLAGRPGWNAPSICLVILAVLVLPLEGAEPPRIDHIEWCPTSPEIVTVHFDTEARRTYTLQYRDVVTTNGLTNSSSTSGTWSNLYTTDGFPFPYHYVISDTATNSRQRFYRLRVTP